jgi:hypothetical protein
MNLKGDSSTKRMIANRLKTFAKKLREDAHRIGTLPTREATSGLVERHAECYAEAAQKSYAADILDMLVKRLEVEVYLKRYPNLKCSICGGKASVCYPRHLEGKSCA